MSHDRRTRTIAAMLGLFLAAATLAPDDPAPKAETDPIRANAQARVEVATKALDVLRTLRTGGGNGFTPGAIVPLTWSRRIYDSQLELARTKVERIAAAQAYLDRVNNYEKNILANHETGVTTTIEVYDAQFMRLSAEGMLARAKAE